MLSGYLRGSKFEASWELLTFELHPVCILGRTEQVLRHKSLVCVQVLLSHQSERDATWELESRMHEQFLELFMSGTGSLLVISSCGYPSSRAMSRIRGRILFKGGRM